MKVDINPFDDDGGVDLTSIDGLQKAGLTVLGFGIFFAMLNVAQATVQPLVESLISNIPQVSTGSTGDSIEVV